MKSKTLRTVFHLTLGLLAGAGSAVAQTTAFTYQGRLTDNGSPASGTYDLRFTIYDSRDGGNPVAGPIVTNAMAISNGLFTVTLDFGSGVFLGSDRWLEVAMRTHTAWNFITLDPRQQITAAPYAIYSANAGTAASVASDAIGASQLASNSVTAAKIASGQVVKSVNGLRDDVYLAGGTNITISTDNNTLRINATFTGTSTTGWGLSGNPQTSSSNFLGTLDNKPLEFRVNNARALRLEPNPLGAPNLIGGDESNFASQGPGCAIAGGTGNRATGPFCAVGGGVDNEAGDSTGTTDNFGRATVAGGESNIGRGGYVAIGGGFENLNLGYGSTIAGGGRNNAANNFSAIGGGSQNLGSGAYATIAGGFQNSATNDHAAIGGGEGNVASGRWSFIGGGSDNTAEADFGTIVGGHQNGAGGYGATVGGGWYNTALNQYAVVGGGVQNTNQGSASSIGGGYRNTVFGLAATISGGQRNTVTELGSEATIGGGSQNYAAKEWATICGGHSNSCIGARGTVSGGEQNTNSADYATIAGGSQNVNSGPYSTIGGGAGNNVENTQSEFSWGNATIAGGVGNRIRRGSSDSTIGGGTFNEIRADCVRATIGGGDNNTILTGADSSTVAGGRWGWIAENSELCAIGGGYINVIASNSVACTIGGGWANKIQEYVYYGTIPGGYHNSVAGSWGFAAGRRAKANHLGSFVWADSTDQDFASLRPNIFMVRASGGVNLYSTPNSTTGVKLDPGSGSWSSVSDRNAKENIAGVDGRQLLDRLALLPISTWNYKSQDKSIRHIGPMAQDFYAAFQVGEDDKHISNVDADGVALAAIQGLYQLLQEKNAQVNVQRTELDGLKQRVAALESLVAALAEKK